MQRTKVFISYSHQDIHWLERLQVHLRPLERKGLLERWDDTRIKPGMRWREEIQQALASTKVAVLLVSADFLASDFIAEHELPSLLHAAEQEGALILPVIVGSCLFDKEPDLAQFQTVNEPDQPLNALDEAKQEELLLSVAKAINDAVNPLNLESHVLTGYVIEDRNQAEIINFFDLFKKLGKVFLDFVTGKEGRIIIFLLSIFMVALPPILVFLSFQKGILLVSFPLFLMFIAGLFAFRLGIHWKKLDHE